MEFGEVERGDVASEEVVPEEESSEVGAVRQRGRQSAIEVVGVELELLQIGEIPYMGRYLSAETVDVELQDEEVREVNNGGVDGAGELIVRKRDLVQCGSVGEVVGQWPGEGVEACSENSEVGTLTQARRDFTTEFIHGEIQDLDKFGDLANG